MRTSFGKCKVNGVFNDRNVYVMRRQTSANDIEPKLL